VDQISKKAIFIAICIALGLIGICALLTFNNVHSPKQFVVHGIFLEKKEYVVNSETGNSRGANLFFKLDSGETVVLNQTPEELKAGDQANIYYHYGSLWKNKIYDYYQKL
jgi:hypothetical protein